MWQIIAAVLQYRWSLLVQWFKRKYQEHSDPRNLEHLLKSGFNIDVNQKTSEPLSFYFWLRLIGSLTKTAILTYEAILSYIYFSDSSMVPYVGNLYGYLGVPRSLLFCPVFALLISQSNIAISVLTIRRNKDMEFMTELLRYIVHGECESRYRKLFDREWVMTIRQDLRPVVAMTSFISTYGFMMYFMIPFSVFLTRVDIELSPIVLCFYIFWSVALGLNVQQHIRRMFDMYVVASVISKLVNMSNRKAMSIAISTNEMYIDQLYSGFNILACMRKWNKIVCIVIGFEIGTVLGFVLTSGFVHLAVKLDTLVFISQSVLIPVFYVSFMFGIFLLSHSTHSMHGRIKHLSSESNRFHWSLLEQYRINIILDGMSHDNSYTCFDIFNIDYPLIVQVKKYSS